MKHVSRPEFRWASHHRVFVQHAPFTQLNAATHHRECADVHTFPQLRFRRNNRLRVDLNLTHVRI
jgi:hypothetical protein